jgi:hypothetical protein
MKAPVLPIYSLRQSKTVAYLFMAAVEDEETQKRGLVTIGYMVGKFIGKTNSELNKRLARDLEWLPVRMTGVHICYDDPKLRAWKPLAMLLMGRHLRLRTRIHDGTN